MVFRVRFYSCSTSALSELPEELRYASSMNHVVLP